MTRNIATTHGHLVSRVAGACPVTVANLSAMLVPAQRIDSAKPSHQTIEDRQSANFNGPWYLGKREPKVAALT